MITQVCMYLINIVYSFDMFIEIEIQIAHLWKNCA